MIDDSPRPRRRRWPWVLLLILLIGGGVVLKGRYDAIVDRERSRVWRAELASLGWEGRDVTLGGLPFIGRVQAIDDFLFADSIAMSVFNDDVAERLIAMKSPGWSGLILVDEGISEEVAKRLRKRYPKARMPRLAGTRPPVAPAAPSPAGAKKP